jgi:hypothetical protein
MYKSDINVLEEMTPQRWIQGMKEIRERGLRPSKVDRNEESKFSPLLTYMLSHDWYGFPGYDIFVGLRLAVEACGSSDQLVYDMSDLVWSGYFDCDEDVVDRGMRDVALDYSSKAKTIVLTEGKTDAWILSQSLRRLYPHLDGYFSFMDFEGTGFGGGVGNLANLVKAFAGAGIINNVIALFDNDTAAGVACKFLDTLFLPANISVQRLPKVDFLKSYPTIGPSGPLRADVNGLAASIELYLGKDVLTVDGVALSPVQWTVFERQLNAYHGEVLDKPRIHERFREKLARPSSKSGPEWDELRAVLGVLFSAFKGANSAAIRSRASQYYAV